MGTPSIRSLVDAELKKTGERPIRPAELEYALALDWVRDGWGDDAEELAQGIADHCREWRHAPEPAPGPAKRPSTQWRMVGESFVHDLPDVPSWWKQERQHIWARYEGRREEMLALFGLETGLADPAEISSLLTRVMESECKEGDWLILDMPTGYVEEENEETGEFISYLDGKYEVVWRGFHRPPLLDSNGAPRPATPEERASEQRVARLAETSQEIADQTGCDQASAVAFLLCREEPQVPYIEVTHSPEQGGMVIVVRDPRVPPKDVATFYRHYRDVGGRPPRQPQTGPYQVVQFVEEARASNPKVSWPEMFERFDHLYPGRYRSTKSFQQAFFSKSPRKK